MSLFGHIPSYTEEFCVKNEPNYDFLVTLALEIDDIDRIRAYSSACFIVEKTPFLKEHNSYPILKGCYNPDSNSAQPFGWTTFLYQVRLRAVSRDIAVNMVTLLNDLEKLLKQPEMKEFTLESVEVVPRGS